jgi:hypothetical protein
MGNARLTFANPSYWEASVGAAERQMQARSAALSGNAAGKVRIGKQMWL